MTNETKNDTKKKLDTITRDVRTKDVTKIFTTVNTGTLFKLLHVHNFVKDTDTEIIRSSSLEEIITASGLTRDEMEKVFAQLCTMNQEYGKDKFICEKISIIEAKMAEEKITKEELVKKLPRGRPKGVYPQDKELEMMLKDAAEMREKYLVGLNELRKIREDMEITKRIQDDELREIKQLKEDFKDRINDLSNTQTQEEIKQVNIDDGMDILSQVKTSDHQEEIKQDTGNNEFNSDFIDNINQIVEEQEEKHYDKPTEKVNLDELVKMHKAQENNQNEELDDEDNIEPQDDKLDDEETDYDETINMLLKSTETKKPKQEETQMKNETKSYTKQIIIIVLIIIAVLAVAIFGIRLYNQSQKPLNVQVPEINTTKQQAPTVVAPQLQPIDTSIIDNNQTTSVDTTINKEDALYHDIDAMQTFDDFQKAISDNKIKVIDNELIVGDRVYSPNDKIGKNFSFVKQYSDGSVKIHSFKENYSKKFRIN